MPDICAHLLCGHDVINSLESQNWKRVLNERIKIFNLGCQGPDIFFYNDFWPWRKKKRGPEIGIMMHLKKTGDFFIESFKYLKKRVNDYNDYLTLFTYLSGFICHFALDRNAHPFIHYQSGVHDKNKPETFKYSIYHKKLELIIDTILLKERKNLYTYKYPVHREVYLQKVPKILINFYKYILKKLYKPKIEIDFIEDSFKDFAKAFKIIHDPYGFKKVLLNIIDLLTDKSIEYSSLIYPRYIDEKKDYLNRKHNLWNHPCAKEEIHYESFDDIYKKAIEESKQMIEGAIRYIDGQIKEEELKDFFPNISYSTGKHVDEDCKLIYYDPIFDR